MKLTATFIIALSAASLAPAQTPANSAPGTDSAANLNVRHVIGLDPIKRNATGQLAIRDNALEFTSGKESNKLTISSIDDIFIGTETTQSGGKAGTAVKTAAIAAPYGSGRALSLMMRTKVDILTVSYHDPDGAVHGAIFALPIGQAEHMRAQLIQSGAHASLSDETGGKP